VYRSSGPNNSPSSDSPRLIRRCRDFTAALSNESFSESDIANAEVVFGELCGNVTRYAPGVLHVLDSGPGFRHISRLPADVLSESGRGLYIIAAMTAEFSVSQRDDGGSHARAVLVGRFPRSLLRSESLPAASDQVSTFF
jgi:anti-sigma regulatory factor (Ser/Thr protein kinase)